MDEGQCYCGLLKGLVPRVVVAKYEDNTPRNKKVMIQVQVSGRQRRRDYSNTCPFFFFKKKVQLKIIIRPKHFFFKGHNSAKNHSTRKLIKYAEVGINQYC
jgi:hypothetical protein